MRSNYIPPKVFGRLGYYGKKGLSQYTNFSCNKKPSGFLEIQSEMETPYEARIFQGCLQGVVTHVSSDSWLQSFYLQTFGLAGIGRCSVCGDPAGVFCFCFF